MNKNIHFYVSPKNGWAWLMAVCLAGSAISRIVLYGIHDMPIYTSLWLQMGLPVAATVLYVLITLCNGREQFYKTAIPVWLYVVVLRGVPGFSGICDMLLNGYGGLFLCAALLVLQDGKEVWCIGYDGGQRLTDALDVYARA